MTFHFVYIVSAFMVAIGIVLANYSVSAAERFYAKFLILAGVIFFALGASWGCSGSPTAPTSTVQLSWASAPGCNPEALSSIPSGPSFGEVQVPGSPTRTIYWLVDGGVLTTTFQQQFGSQLYLLCSVTSGGAK